MIGLIDCNNFFVSCETIFNPLLRGRPVVVLSNNDGCVIARSKEAKELGIAMGAPAHECKSVFETQKVAVISSNFALYGDISARVMQLIGSFSPEIQVYSIDEAFISFKGENVLEEALEIRQKILQYVGIPVSIGIGKTKTLAKAASELAKKKHDGIFILDEKEEAVLDSFPVEEIWGCGKKTSEKLRRQGIFSAKAFRDLDDYWLRKNLSVTGLRMAWELRGIPCFNMEEIPAKKKSIINSRSFGRPLDSFEEVAEALSTYVAHAAEKMRRQESLASALEVFITTNPFNNTPFYAESARITFPEPLDYTPALIMSAKTILKALFKPGYFYKKTGVCLLGLTDRKHMVRDLFATRQDNSKKRHLMSVIDALNTHKKSVYFAAEGLSHEWRGKKERSSPRYTTNWDEILKINIS